MKKKKTSKKPTMVRYQYIGRNGIEWTEWFTFTGNETPSKQQANGLSYEYK